MWDWLASPVDPTRAHEIGAATAWHARSMMLAWGVLAPLAVIIARFFKILPGQDWPRVLDTTFWWRSHWIGQTLVLVLSITGFVLVLPRDPGAVGLHAWLGYGVLLALLVQVLLGVFRGSKGGPTDSQLRGHHYDMTPRRRMFEALHKALGYGVLAIAAVTVLSGLWYANAPKWMGVTIVLWWAFLVVCFIHLQRRGMAVDTYQAIWGDDPAHPGNRLPTPGWGVRRVEDVKTGDSDVRDDRGNGVSSP